MTMSTKWLIEFFIQELRRKLAGLIRDNKELEEKRMALCDKIQQERSACVQLRVEIKLEQERIRKRNGWL